MTRLMRCFHAPGPVNEPNLTYAPGTPERAELRARLDEMQSPSGSRSPASSAARTSARGDTFDGRDAAPARARARRRPPAAARPRSSARSRPPPTAWHDWSRTPWRGARRRLPARGRAARRPVAPTLNAATMLGQSKTAHQAEIDAACELIDFWRFNVRLPGRGSTPSSRISSPGVWNRMEYRPLEGFVFAVTPVQLHLDRRQPADRARR